MVKISELSSLAAATVDDTLAIVDIAGNVTNKVRVDALIPDAMIATAKLANGAVTSPIFKPTSGVLTTSANPFTKGTAYNVYETITGMSVSLTTSVASKIMVWGVVEVTNTSASASYIRVTPRWNGSASGSSISPQIAAGAVVSIPVMALITATATTANLDVQIRSDSNLVFTVAQASTAVNYVVMSS